MSEYHLIPARRVETELIDRNSRFITNAAPAFSVEEAQAFIDCVRKKHPDANHHVPVYLIGHGNAVIAHCSDAGEPAGTAGRPALAVLQGSGLGDIVAVITRYFGGRNWGQEVWSGRIATVSGYCWKNSHLRKRWPLRRSCSWCPIHFLSKQS